MSGSADTLVRKTVTVLFCDVTGFTSLGERMDPEAMRRVMLRYFDEMRAVLERHGGTVEKFIGDAVMAVFGVPRVHEDDALRAVRAAGEMRKRLAELNTELEQRWGVRLEARIGINTGEVVAGEGQTMATGDAVNVAARLQQAAEPGEILLGKETYALVSGAVDAGPLESFAVKGRSAEVHTWRLEEVRSSAEQVFQRLGSPIVGRTREQQVLHALYRDAIDDQSCQLVTIVGPAGIGKTRLAQEIAAHLFGATVAVGRCLPYGDGITFFPVVEIVRSLAGVAADDSAERALPRITSLVDGDQSVAERVAEVLGFGSEARPDEAFWALRRLFESVARRRPVVLVLEDVHWADATLLDLVEYLVGWSRGAPLLVVCLARPELLEERSSWPGERITLEPLADADVQALLTNILGAAELEPEAAKRIAAAAEGNPLFVEELVRMLIDDGALAREGGRWVTTQDIDTLAIPPTINALLSARLDRLASEERAVLQCASVVGKEFWWTAVTELAPKALRATVATHLHELVRKRLIFPAESTAFAGEDSFRFGHILVRDAAYAALPKATRAELHERFTEWLEEHGAPEEMRGHHLEQAYLTRAELSPPDAALLDLGQRAGTLLASAGRRAFLREDMPTARSTLSRAVALLAAGEPRVEAQVALAIALRDTGRLAESASILEDALVDATALGNERLIARVRIERSALRATMDPSMATADLVAVAEQAIDVFRKAGDDHGLAKAWIHIAEMHWFRGNCSDMERVLERALVHAEKARAGRERRWILRALMRAALLGPRVVDDAIRRCNELAGHAPDDAVIAANAESMLAVLEAMRGDTERSRRHYERSKTILHETGLTTILGSMQMYAGMAELIAANAAAAERELRYGFDLLEEIGAQDKLSTTAAYLARALAAQQRYEEADAVTRVSEEAASDDDVATHIIWRGVRARVEAHRGDLPLAERFARGAVSLSQQTDLLAIQAEALSELADVFSAAGKGEAAAAAVESAIELFTAKGSTADAERARERRVELAGVQPA